MKKKKKNGARRVKMQVSQMNPPVTFILEFWTPMMDELNGAVRKEPSLEFISTNRDEPV